MALNYKVYNAIQDCIGDRKIMAAGKAFDKDSYDREALLVYTASEELRKADELFSQLEEEIANPLFSEALEHLKLAMNLIKNQR